MYAIIRAMRDCVGATLVVPAAASDVVVLAAAAVDPGVVACVVVVSTVEAGVVLVVTSAPTQTPFSHVPPSGQVHSELPVTRLTVQFGPVQPGRHIRLPLRAHV